MSDNTMAAAPEEREIVGTCPEIIVEGTAEEPYFSIRYIDSKDGMCYVGFGSYCLENVFQWLKEYFGRDRAYIVDPEELRPKGRWKDVHLPNGETAYRCTNCRTTWDDKTKACPNCGAKMEET